MWLLTANVEGVIDRANPVSERVFGYPPVELLGLRIDTQVPEIAAAGSMAAGRDRLSGSSDTYRGARVSPEVTARRSDGSCFPAEIAVSRARHGRNEVFVICLRDISETARLRGSAARQRGTLSFAGRQCPGSHCRHRRGDRRFIEANDSALSLFR